jgi:SCF-associated factor 1
MTALQDLPVEVLLDHLFPSIETLDLLHLGATCRSLAHLTNDNTLWKRKLNEDFNFAVEDTARTSGWKLIYRGLSRPRIFVWG